MRALVIGASGQVGAALLTTLRARGHEARGTYGHNAAPGLDPLDLTDHAAVARAVAAARPDWVFCPAGLSHVDYCEDHVEEALAANRDGPEAAARAAESAGAGFVFYSSDYVFDGVAGPFSEDDTPRPLSVYGRSKHEGEGAVLAACRRAVVIRTSVVYGPERQEKNFVYQLIRACRAGQGFRPAVDQHASRSYSPDVAAASVELCERGLLGLWHVAGSEVLDRYAFALLICREFGLDVSRLTAVTTAALGQKAPRPLDGGLRVAKAQARLTTRLRGPAEGLHAMREALERGRAGVDQPRNIK
ncbi:MAG: SDR family oxidoreductase [Gemmatimonadales bacterium]